MAELRWREFPLDSTRTGVRVAPPPQLVLAYSTGKSRRWGRRAAASRKTKSPLSLSLSLSIYLCISRSISRSPKERTRPQRLSSPPPSTSGRCGWQSGAGPALVQPISVFAAARSSSRGILHITSRERSSATEARSEELLIERGRRWGLGGEKRDLSLCRAGGLSSATAPDRPGV